MDQFVDRTRAMGDVAGFDDRLGEWKQQQQQHRYAQWRYAAAPVAPDLPSLFHRAALSHFPGGTGIPQRTIYPKIMRGRVSILASKRIATAENGVWRKASAAAGT